MARCEYCGNVVPDGQATCPVCGAAMSNQANTSYRSGGNANQQYNQQSYNNQGYYNQSNNYQNNPYQNNTYQNNSNSLDGQDFTYMYDPMDIQNNKAMAVLSYLGILCLIPLFANKTSRYARFHTSQGLTLFAIEVIINVVFRISAFGFRHIFLVGTVGSLVGIGVLILTILGIINAANGRAKELPIIGKIHIINLF